MTPELFVAIAAMIGTIIAAVFAEQSASSARHSAHSAQSSAKSAMHANDIALHAERLAIYKDFQQFHMTLHIEGLSFPASAIWRFQPSSNLSEFFFPEETYIELACIVLVAFELVSDLAKWEQELAINAENAKSLRAVLGDKHLALRDRCEALDETLRARLRVDRADAVVAD